MKTIRRGVFETNSSTTHCATYSKSYKNITDIPLRNASEFPKLNENNELEVELNIYWDMQVREDDSIDLSSVDTVIKYLAAHAVFSSTETLYSRKNHETIYNYDKNHKELLHDIQEAYKTMGLTVPVDVRPYFLDVNDNKIYITTENINKWFIPYEGSWYDTKREWQQYVKKTITRNPDAVNWPYAKYYIGMCGNDLCCSSYECATEYYEDLSNGYNWDEEREEDEVGITTHDMLTRQISLSFYHT